MTFASKAGMYYKAELFTKQNPLKQKKMRTSKKNYKGNIKCTQAANTDATLVKI